MPKIASNQNSYVTNCHFCSLAPRINSKGPQGPEGPLAPSPQGPEGPLGPTARCARGGRNTERKNTEQLNTAQQNGSGLAVFGEAGSKLRKGKPCVQAPRAFGVENFVEEDLK